ncbi:hypothetical protein RUMHYD_02912 [Blautia hydrogenotrophica DSM 10507]|uniref:Uncharacterized protein n=1 Tax=Blautia hydrogenotrophica (strain DSM 10507 / JCM 14656 / S5a33) TaxID=476272 RepID=C0CPW0_BLAHS|nr:hypothetical protein RUMHYD_02912 [Blautia hydrogenotrophica DSM 10507]
MFTRKICWISRKIKNPLGRMYTPQHGNFIVFALLRQSGRWNFASCHKRRILQAGFFFCRKILAHKVRHTFKVKEIGEVFVNFVVFC